MDIYLDWITPRSADENLRYARAEKKYVIEQMARQCDVGEKLVDYWMKHDTKNPEAVAFFAACKGLFDEGIPAGYLYTAREAWDTKDWRGKKGQSPTPAQLLEQSLRILGPNSLLLPHNAAE